MYLARLLKTNSRLIVSQRDQGLGDNLAAAANAWYFAKQTRRDLMILWTPSRYLAHKNENAFPQFFTLPASLEGVRIFTPPQIDPLSRLLIARSDFFHAYLFPDPILSAWTALYAASRALRFQNASARLRANIEKRLVIRRAQHAQAIYAETDLPARLVLVNGCLVPRPVLKPFYEALQLARLQPRVDDFARDHFANQRVIGAHIRYRTHSMGEGSRHSAYWNEPEHALRVCHAQIQAALRRVAPAPAVIFLATDSARVQDFFKTKFTNLVTYPKPFPADDTREMHETLPIETVESASIEMFLLAQSDVLVRYPPTSYFSFYASLYAKQVIALEE